MFEYNEKVLEHFLEPKNIGDIEDADARVTIGDPRCGDFIRVCIRMQDGRIDKFKYKVYGCAAAIATTSVVSMLAINKTAAEALSLTDDDVIAYLGGLPEGKRHCSLLGIRGLHAALSQYGGQMKNPKAKIAHYSEMEAKLFGESAPGTAIRVLISDESDGAPFYNMRMIEVEPGGHTPDHSHPYEHENFIVEGQGELRIEESWHALRPGTVAFVPAGVRHQYRNTGSSTLRFLCSVPVERLRTPE